MGVTRLSLGIENFDPEILELNNRAHRTGRAVGLGEAEQPELRESDATILQEGMTFTVEPGIYVPGVGGARFGDTVVVTPTGYENLSPAPYEWQL